MPLENEQSQEKVEDFMTVQQVAAMLGVTDGAVRIAVMEGRLSSVHILGRKLIRKVDAEQYQERTRPAGVKPKGRPKKQPEQAKDE